MAEYGEEERKEDGFYIPLLLFCNTVIMLGVAYFQFTLYQKQSQESPSIQDIVASTRKRK